MGKTQQLRTPKAKFSTCTKQERAPGLQLGATTVSIITTCQNIRVPVSLPQTGASCKSSTRRESVIMRNMRDQPRTTWTVTWRELGPQSPWLPLVTQYTVMDYNPAAHVRFPLSHQHMSRPVWSLPGTISMNQGRHGRSSCGQMGPK